MMTDRELLAAANAEISRLKDIIRREAEYCFQYAEKYAVQPDEDGDDTNPLGDAERSARHRARGERLMKAMEDGK